VLIMLDIDHFKRVNDSHGHQAGDEVIRMVARSVAETKRLTDVAARYGGEEFAVLLLDTDRTGGRRFAERLRGDIEARSVQHCGREIRCTVSLGLAEFDAGLQDSDAWVARADTALYRAKAEGRNRATEFIPST
jgi:diguanylate cyclase (GGDEF)-like protein